MTAAVLFTHSNEPSTVSWRDMSARLCQIWIDVTIFPKKHFTFLINWPVTDKRMGAGHTDEY